eukprot:IDg1923t1
MYCALCVMCNPVRDVTSNSRFFCDNSHRAVIFYIRRCAVLACCSKRFWPAAQYRGCKMRHHRATVRKSGSTGHCALHTEARFLSDERSDRVPPSCTLHSLCEFARYLIETPVLCGQRTLGIAAKWRACAGSERICEDRVSLSFLAAMGCLLRSMANDSRCGNATRFMSTVGLVGAKRRPDTYCKRIMSGADTDRLAISNLSSFYELLPIMQYRRELR